MPCFYLLNIVDILNGNLCRANRRKLCNYLNHNRTMFCPFLSYMRTIFWFMFPNLWFYLSQMAQCFFQKSWRVFRTSIIASVLQWKSRQSCWPLVLYKANPKYFYKDLLSAQTFHRQEGNLHRFYQLLEKMSRYFLRCLPYSLNETFLPCAKNINQGLTSLCSDPLNTSS